MNKLSHSSVSRFQECPKSYDFHYNQKLRHKYFSSALLFGSAIDKALEYGVKRPEASVTDLENIFLGHWAAQEVNKVATYLIQNTNIVYANSDIDLDLISEDDKLVLEATYAGWETNFGNLVKKKEHVGFNSLKTEEKAFYNYVAWFMLATKGKLMMKAFKEKILPKIKKVLATQKKIDLINPEGDVITGYADLICEWETGDVIVFDFKTSTRNYEETSVLTSPQLSLYIFDLCQEYKTRKAGYIVFNKRVMKNKIKICANCGHNGTGSRARTCDETIAGDRCKGEWIEKLNPDIYTQIIIDEIPQQTENIVIENIEHINSQIKNGVFTRNLQSCVRPWGKCAFFDLCYKGDDSELIKVE